VTGLDPAGVTELYQGLRELNASHGITIIMVSHDVKQVLNEAKQVLHIGEQIFAGDVEEYKKMKGASL